MMSYFQLFKSVLLFLCFFARLYEFRKGISFGNLNFSKNSFETVYFKDILMCLIVIRLNAFDFCLFACTMSCLQLFKLLLSIVFLAGLYEFRKIMSFGNLNVCNNWFETGSLFCKDILVRLFVIRLSHFNFSFVYLYEERLC